MKKSFMTGDIQSAVISSMMILIRHSSFMVICVCATIRAASEVVLFFTTDLGDHSWSDKLPAQHRIPRMDSFSMMINGITA
jgi:hypothetical protein